MTSEDRADKIMDTFKRIGQKRYTDGINPPREGKESIVALTENIRAIEAHAQLALKHADAREYNKAYLDLDVIEAKVRIIRAHLDHLYDVLPRLPMPAGEESP